MAASNCPETPRQKMIGMMYLVLTAMLAINISNEVLDAFAKVDQGLNQTNANFSAKNYGIYSDLEQQHQINPEKVGLIWQDAQELQKRSNELFDGIQGYKKELVVAVDGSEGDPSNILNKDNRDASSTIMLTQGKAEELKNAIANYKAFLLDKVIQSDDTTEVVKERIRSLKEGIGKNLDTPNSKSVDGAIVPWESSNFESMPVISSVTLLSKMQNDIRNAESDALNFLASKIDAKSYKFTSVTGKVIGTEYALTGSPYQFEIFAAALDSTQNPEVVVTGMSSPILSEGGVAKYETSFSSVGKKLISGFIKFKNPYGKIENIPYEHEVTVAAPSAVVAATKMNVFYKGIDNPITVSAAGIPESQIQVQGTGVSISGSGINRTVRPSGAVGSTAKVSIIANGKNMGTQEFRIKGLPDPVPMVGSKKGGTISKAELLQNGGVDAVLADFPFDLRYNITGFTVTVVQKGGFSNESKSSGRSFSSAQISAINSLDRGKKVYIDNIKASGPDGKVRDLPSLAFRIR